MHAGKRFQPKSPTSWIKDRSLVKDLHSQETNWSRIVSSPQRGNPKTNTTYYDTDESIAVLLKQRKSAPVKFQPHVQNSLGIIVSSKEYEEQQFDQVLDQVHSWVNTKSLPECLCNYITRSKCPRREVVGNSSKCSPISCNCNA
ncbi:hypothetical protein ST47_g3590 [Ascochyta rabiei]|uniref:Uncharacterized protein n=1 Tax=Didymella rabiei TaxID=5454 RepID=A0A163HG12_DIDRA|nr:hypothetical protein ST47_g3590 [Ascochyta rabiei]